MKNLIILFGMVLLFAVVIGNAQGHSGWGMQDLPPGADNCCSCHDGSKPGIDAGPSNGVMCEK